MIKRLLLDDEPKRISVKPREDSPRVLFLGEGVGARTLETLLRQGVNIKWVISGGLDDPVVKTAKLNHIPSGCIGVEDNLYASGLGASYDYAVLAFWSKKLPGSNFPTGKKRRIIGLHASELPQYRGGYPIEAALLDDRSNTMISTYYLTPEIDEGPVLVMQSFGLWDRVRKGKNANQIYQDVAVAGGRLLATTLFNIKGQTPMRQKGNPSYSHEPTEKDLTVNWKEHTSRHIMNMLVAGGMVYTTFEGKKAVIEGLEWGKIPKGYVGSAGEIVFEGRRYDKPMVVTHDLRLLGISVASVKSVGLNAEDFKKYVAVNYRLGHRNQFY